MSSIKAKIKAAVRWAQLPGAARASLAADRAGLPRQDPGPERIIEEGIAWLGRAQDFSRTSDGGVARDFSLIDGWAPSYPETTGYIVETMIAYGQEHGKSEPVDRGRRMLDWLVSIQFPEGGFQGGRVDQTPRVPVTFNTGQILTGLAAGARIDDKYMSAMRRAADWLATTQDDDGCWRKHGTPFARPGEKAYETHVSLGLFRADAVSPGRGYGDAARRQVDWALTNLKPNGWMAKCCLDDPERPLTHTLGYALRGIIEAWLATHDTRYLKAAQSLADGLLTAVKPDGSLPGRLDAQWQAAVDYVCLTGLSQISECWLLLHRDTGNAAYKQAALKGNSFVRRTVLVDGPAETRGGVKGSFPVNGAYGRWQFLNWACKFTIDANRAELCS